jgi:dihydrolipoamide dehydrogenase
MKSTITTDIAVIGAGTAGLTAFSEITRVGRTALLIDRGPLGSTCARVGCMPSKAVLHAGEQWAMMSQCAPGALPLTSQTPDSLWQHARATRDALARETAETTVAKAGDRLLMGEARFLSPDTLDVDGQRITAKAFVLATGSRPVVPAFLAGLGARVLTTDRHSGPWRHWPGNGTGAGKTWRAGGGRRLAVHPRRHHRPRYSGPCTRTIQR